MLIILALEWSVEPGRSEVQGQALCYIVIFLRAAWAPSGPVSKQSNDRSGGSSVVACLLRMHEDLASVPDTRTEIMGETQTM